MVIRENSMFYYDRTIKEEAVMSKLSKVALIMALGSIVLEYGYNLGYKSALRKCDNELQVVINVVKSSLENKEES